MSGSCKQACLKTVQLGFLSKLLVRLKTHYLEVCPILGVAREKFSCYTLQEEKLGNDG